MKPLNRVFLGWKQPAVQSSAQFLLDRYTTDGLADLTPVTIVTPTRRAGRRLREVLMQLAAERAVGLFPPKVATVGALPELLYEKKLPFAPRHFDVVFCKGSLHHTRDHVAFLSHCNEADVSAFFFQVIQQPALNFTRTPIGIQ